MRLIITALLLAGCAPTYPVTSTPGCSAFIEEAPPVLGEDGLNCIYAGTPTMVAPGLRVERPDGSRLVMAFAIDKTKLQQVVSYTLPLDGLKVVTTTGFKDDYVKGAPIPNLCTSFIGSFYYEDLENDYATFFEVTCAAGSQVGSKFTGWFHGVR